MATLALDKNFMEPESWIALANNFSLIQDHDSAIKYLKRAIQIDSKNSYAYCLTGHEYSSKEQYDKARDYYKKALQYDSKNVRALWGLGNLCLKTESFTKAVDFLG